MEEIQRLKDCLLPSAGKLREAADALAEELGADSPAAGDAALLRATAVALEKAAAGLAPDEDPGRVRHDLKNLLNRATGAAQFVAMALGSDHASPGLAAALDACEQFLLAIESEAGESRGTRSLAEPGPLRPAPAPGRILVADDDAENRELLARLLQAQGHQVVHAADGREALEIIRDDDDLDAVLLDINMPEMDGFAVLETLRASGRLRQVPVIVVTGLQEERDAARCIEIGAEDFLSRPIRPALLTARLNASLEKKRLREQVFEQHFTPKLAREFARNPDLMNLKGRSAEVSVLFCDIRGFSAISERLGPEATLDWLGGVMGEFSASALDAGGVLVDYTGDELLAMWGAPGDQPDHAALACRAALDMLSKLPGLNQRWRSRIGAETAIGIGISTGEALVGNIGTHRKFKYGPLGTTVNLGSRVQAATKTLRASLIVTGATARQTGGEGFASRRLCRARLRNIRGPVELHEMALPGFPRWEELKARYEAALAHFEAARFRESSAILGELLVAFPGDGPSLLLMSRVVQAMLAGSEAPFDSVWDLLGA